MFLEHFPEEGNFRGWIEVVCGSMFSGKTEELIRRLKRVEFAGIDLLLFKPRVDVRYAKKSIVSHGGNKFKAIEIDTAEEIWNYWRNQPVVAFDEAQFFDMNLVEVANELAAKNVRVIVAGLDMDFQGKPYGPIPHLMATAEYVTKVHAICMSCGNLAQFSHRKTQVDDQLFLGANKDYEPLCRNCYNKTKK